MSKLEFGLLVFAAALASVAIRIWIENAPNVALQAGLPAVPRVPTGSST